ncbi:O-antigen ligase family protein [Pectinatus frisingensis]|jgi:putative inorganic carbon (HCO3(-)) transporter|uniref:O-antigen ligase family protein n=1 Tax=Pectinatus frisingensis TaxID=865 RepID=UPI0018C7A7D2|nr:O-antigen ligase family protein [Pectinatus frisingensis]
MNIFTRKKYARDCSAMMFYALLAVIFFLPFSNDAATYALLLGWFFYLLRTRFTGWTWKRTKLDFPLAVFIVMSFLSIFNSPEKVFSFYNCYHLVGKYVLVYYLAIQSVEDEQQIKKIVFVLGSAALIVILYGFVQYIAGINTTAMDWTDNSAFPGMTTRVFSTWKNPNLLAGYLDIILSLAFGLFFYTKNRKFRIIIGGLFLLALICLGMTYARGALFSIAIVIILYALCYNKRIILPFIVLAFVLLYADPILIDRMMSVFTSMDTSSELRIALWESTIEMILDHPLLGIGWGAYYFVYPSYDFYMQGNFIKIVHAHNMYLNIAAEVGLIGFAGFISCFIGSLWRSLKNFKFMPSVFLQGTLLGCGLALVTVMLNGFTDYVLFNTNMSMLFWFIMALSTILLSNKSLQKAKKILKSKHPGLTSIPELSDEEIKKNKEFNFPI